MYAGVRTAVSPIEELKHFDELWQAREAQVRTAVSPIEELKQLLGCLLRNRGGVRTAVSPIEELKRVKLLSMKADTFRQNSG